MASRHKSAISKLTQEVERALSSLYNIQGVQFRNVRGYRGEPKIKIPDRWPQRQLPLSVCDAECGEQQLVVLTTKPGAIRRILCKKFGDRVAAL